MSYGTAVLKDGVWQIDAAPHVIMRLKRVFGRFGQRVSNTVTLTDTLEVCRDLSWFCKRFALDVTPARYLAKRAREHVQQAEEMAAVFAGEIDPRPFDLAIPARGYQRIAAEALLRRGGLLLADDVGIGKTVSAIAALTHAGTRPALVVTLAPLPVQWEREINRFAPALTTHIINKSTPYAITRSRTGQGLLFPERDPDVLITSYHKLDGWREVLAGKIRTVVFDEVQELRTGFNRSPPAKYGAAEAIAAQASYRMGLTATPIYNYGGEFFSVLNVLTPDALGTHTEFHSEWCQGDVGRKAKVTDPAAFGTYLRDQGLMLRRTRAEVGRELPPCSTVLHHVHADEQQLDAVRGDAAELAKLILSSTGSGFDKMRAAEELNMMLRHVTGVAKAPYVAAFVRMLVEAGEKVVLYGWHRDVYAIWQAQLDNLNPVMYTGTESPSKKRASVEAFVRGDARVLIISLRAGAGLDGLQHASRIAVFGELDWSPGVQFQCVGRLFRDGQKDPVTAYMLLADTGSDPIVADILGLKQSQLDGVMEPERPLLEKLQVSPDHIKQLAAGYLEQINRKKNGSAQAPSNRSRSDEPVAEATSAPSAP